MSLMLLFFYVHRTYFQLHINVYMSSWAFFICRWFVPNESSNLIFFAFLHTEYSNYLKDIKHYSFFFVVQSWSVDKIEGWLLLVQYLKILRNLNYHNVFISSWLSWLIYCWSFRCSHRGVNRIFTPDALPHGRQETQSPYIPDLKNTRCKNEGMT